MRIGINLLYLIPGKVGGTETYARELLPILAVGNELVIYCGRETAPTFMDIPHCQIIALPLYSRHRLARLLVEQTILPLRLIQDRIEVIFSLGYSSPIWHSCPAVVTVHDLNWYSHPEDFSPLSRLVWRYLTTWSARSADHVITDSRSSAEAICQVLHLSPVKVTPILHATPTKITVTPPTSRRPYLLTVLANYPHKNLVTLLRAFALLSEEFPDLDLLVCGLGKQPSSDSHLRYLGYVTRAKLAQLYTGASVFVFPSAYEGFGYPVLEAMSYGAPVVCSDATSLPQVVGKGGILVDTFAVDQYVQAIAYLLRSSIARHKYITLGTKRALELKWEDTSSTTLSVLKHLGVK